MDRFLTLVANHPVFGMLGAIALLYIGFCCGRWFAPKILEIFFTAIVVLVLTIEPGMHYGRVMGAFVFVLLGSGFIAGWVYHLVDIIKWPANLSWMRPQTNP